MLLTHEHCYECGETTAHHNGRCAACESKKHKAERDAHFVELGEMTLEQRVRRIEEYLYELPDQFHPLTDR